MVKLKQLKDNEIAFNDEFDKILEPIPRLKRRRMALLQNRHFLN